MKVISYTALHYGSDYLYHAIRSVIDHVDEHVVLYSPVGSHGTRTALPCPDSRQQMYDLAALAAGDKLRWVDGEWSDEGKQRESIHLVAPDADVILVVDADEIWPEGYAQSPRNFFDSFLQGGPKPYRQYRVPIIHFWRSFYRCVLHDPAFPTRIIFPSGQPGEGGMGGYLYDGTGPISICHMGYAQRPDIIYYKQYVHGHRGEWRWQDDWFHTIFMTNRQHDCHPVGSEYWNPEPVNPWDYMPAFMREHPYANLDVIGEVTEAAK